jgi:hypothetical protein
MTWRDYRKNIKVKGSSECYDYSRSKKRESKGKSFIQKISFHIWSPLQVVKKKKKEKERFRPEDSF